MLAQKIDSSVNVQAQDQTKLVNLCDRLNHKGRDSSSDC